jgi:hypothetical protein
VDEIRTVDKFFVMSETVADTRGSLFGVLTMKDAT